MKSPSLWRLSVTAPAETEDALVALLERLVGQPPSIYSPDGKTHSVVTVYSSKPIAEIRAQETQLRAELRALRQFGLRTGRPKIALERVPREDWTTSWKKYFKTIEVGSKLLIRPSWSKRVPRAGQAVVTLDPGLSFGTGQHPTTGFCLEQLVHSRKVGRAQAFLDIGTGSGILAIAAVKLGYSPVGAFDNDPVAVRVAQANARRNRVAGRLHVSQEDLTRLPVRAKDRYEVICANLTHDLLESQLPRVLGRLASGGRLILAGLLVRQFAGVARVYRKAGLQLEVARTEGEWRSGAFVNPREK